MELESVGEIGSVVWLSIVQQGQAEVTSHIRRVSETQYTWQRSEQYPWYLASDASTDVTTATFGCRHCKLILLNFYSLGTIVKDVCNDFVLARDVERTRQHTRADKSMEAKVHYLVTRLR